MKSVIAFALSVLLTPGLYAQTVAKKPSGKNQIRANMPDDAMNQRLIKHLADNIPETRNETVTWTGTYYGYLATYIIENVSGMTLYDRSGNYVETFSKQAWDDRVPSIIKMEFENSPYDSFSVEGFWEGTGNSSKHYYLEMIDKNSSSKNVWCDENGKFSDVPFTRN